MSVMYLPGEVVDVGPSESSQIIGYGIEKRKDVLVACQPGLFRTHSNKKWISVQSKRYIPQKGDRVLGIINCKTGDQFKLDIGAADFAVISFLSFEGATKRNRPNLKTGDVVYAQVILASKHLEPELTCIDSDFKARGMGILNGGFIFKVSTNLARRLLSPHCGLLKLLGKDYKFEITVGINGKVWLKGPHHKEIVSIYNIIKWSEFILECDMADYVDKEIRKAKGLVPMDSE